MPNDDWCRRTTWTTEDQRAFAERNRRSRGADSKAQYVRIQAETLFQTGDKELIISALELLEQSFADYPHSFDCAQSYECAARCCETLGRIEDAISYYRRALDREKEFPGIGTNACFHFAKLIATHRRHDAFDEALEALNKFGHPVFPWHAYMSYGPQALIAHERGDSVSAKAHAEAAIEASNVRDSSLGWGRGEIGIVNNLESEMHRQLQKLAGV
jgi:tetratricopeptide (TPR) repeat protein